MATTYDSVEDLAEALRRAAARTASTSNESAKRTRIGRIGTRSTWCARARARSCRHEQRLRRDRARRRLAGRALRGRPGGGRPARGSRRARARGRGVLLLGLHSLEDAAATGRGGAWGARGRGERRRRCGGGACVARLHRLRLLRRRTGALARRKRHRPAARQWTARRAGRRRGRRRAPHRRPRGPRQRRRSGHTAGPGPARARGRVDEPRGDRP